MRQQHSRVSSAPVRKSSTEQTNKQNKITHHQRSHSDNNNRIRTSRPTSNHGSHKQVLRKGHHNGQNHNRSKSSQLSSRVQRPTQYQPLKMKSSHNNHAHKIKSRPDRSHRENDKITRSSHHEQNRNHTSSKAPSSRPEKSCHNQSVRPRSQSANSIKRNEQNRNQTSSNREHRAADQRNRHHRPRSQHQPNSTRSTHQNHNSRQERHGNHTSGMKTRPERHERSNREKMTRSTHQNSNGRGEQNRNNRTMRSNRPDTQHHKTDQPVRPRSQSVRFRPASVNQENHTRVGKTNISTNSTNTATHRPPSCRQNQQHQHRPHSGRQIQQTHQDQRLLRLKGGV
eukprot:UN23908